MDTGTVLKIIAMIDARISYSTMNKKDSNDMMVLSDLGAIQALKEFRDHLQDFIESEVSKVENEMNRGE